MAKDYDPSKDPIWLRRTVYRLFSTPSAPAGADPGSVVPQRSLRQVIGEKVTGDYMQCQLCRVPKRVTKPVFGKSDFSWYEDRFKSSRFGPRETLQICDQCAAEWATLEVETNNTLVLASRFMRSLAKAEAELAAAESAREPYGELFPAAVRARHLYLIGGTGSGKTTLLKNLLLDDFANGTGCGFIDPHGDAADFLLGHVPESRIADLVYFAPAMDRCPSLNPLALPLPPHKLVADLVSLFRLFFEQSWGPQLHMVLSHGLTALILDRERNGEPHTLADLRRFLTREDYRDSIADRLPDESEREWWALEFPSLARTAVNPVLNKLDAFMPPASPLRRLFSNPRNDIDFSAILNGQQIFLANLSKGELGEEPARLLGGILTACLTNAALARSKVPEHQRRPFHLYADEFHSYAVDTFATILDETRKYGLWVTLANQSFARLPSDLQHAITANVGTWVVFACSPDDAAKLKRGMEGTRPSIEPEVLSTLRQRARHLSDAREIVSRFRDFPHNEKAPWTSQWTLSPRSDFDRVCRIYDYLQEHPLPDDIDLSSLPTVPFPSVSDIIRLEPLDAIYRRMKADDVGRIRVPFPPDPDPAHRARVVAALRERYQPPPQPPTPSASTEKRRMIPQTEEDEFF